MLSNKEKCIEIIFVPFKCAFFRIRKTYECRDFFFFFVISVFFFFFNRRYRIAHLSDAPRKRLVVTGDSARIQDVTIESSAWFFNVLGV